MCLLKLFDLFVFSATMPRETAQEKAKKLRQLAEERGLLAQNAASVPKPTAKKKAGNGNDVVQLQFWNDRVRGLPNPMARSALFTVSNKARRTFANAPIVSSSDFELFYTGEELRQIDEDVFLQIVHLARMRPLGDVVDISGYQLLKALGWSFDSRAYTRLRESIERLANGKLKIHFAEKGKVGYIGSMIRKVLWSGETAGRTKWKIFLEPEIISLFDSDGFSLILWEQRLRLPMLSKWLLSFYYTHAKPLPYKVETLYTMCGSGTKTLAHFRSELKGALENLVNAGFLTSWEITTADLVKVERNRQPELSQR